MSLRLHSNLLYQKFLTDDSPRHCLRSARQHRKKCSLLSGFARDQFLLKRKGYFSLMFCPPSIRAGGGTNADSVLQKLFFGERILQNFGSFVFEFGCRKWKRRVRSVASQGRSERRRVRRGRGICQQANIRDLEMNFPFAT